MAQELVALDAATHGSLELASRLADRIEGWRRGVAYAELAKIMADRGTLPEARAYIEKAEAVRRSIKGWENPRIAAHVAQARSMLGDANPAEQFRGMIDPNDRQYFGRPEATTAASCARRGEFEQAMKLLDAIDPAGDEDFAWWKTAGYVDVARSPKLTAEQRRRALESARRSATEVPGWRRAEALQNLARACRDTREDALLRAVLVDTETVLLGLSPRLVNVKSPMLAETARFWARLGAAEKVKPLLEAAEATATEAMVTERPAIYADVANAWAAAGNEAKSGALYAQAFATAEALVNARPRALAVVEIARSLGRAGIDPDAAVRQRFEALFAGLKAPW
jgi:hypothetical protein